MPEKTSFTRSCTVCHTVHVIEVDKEKYDRWRGGELIQNVWPELTIVEREIMISGTCGPCFDKLFGESEY